MTELTNALADLERRLVVCGRESAAQALRPGLERDGVTDSLRARHLPAHQDIIDLFGWHDGVDAPEDDVMDDVQVFPGFYLPSLDECLSNYDAFLPSERWDRLWLPILANGGGDFYLLDLTGNDASVRHFRIDESEHPVEFSRLANFVETMNLAYDRGIIFIEDGYLEMDDLAFGDLAAEQEPGVEWWRS